MARSKIAEDLFDRADGVIGADWSYIRLSSFQPTAPSITGQRVRPHAAGSNYQVMRWNGAGTFSDDQYAKVSIENFTFQSADYRAGVVVRCSADTDANADYYAFWVQDDGGASSRTSKLVKVVNGALTELDSRVGAWASDDTVSLEVEGTTLRAYKNDVELFSVDDPDITTGKPGFLVAGGPSARADNWEGGDVVAGGATRNVAGANSTQSNTSTQGAITIAESTGTITTHPFKNNAGDPLTGLTGLTVAILDLATMTEVVVLTGQTTDASTAVMTLTHALIVPGTWYAVAPKSATDILGIRKYQAT